MKRNIVALMTDFGLEDVYVGSMKAVLYAMNSKLKIVDISHSIKPQSILNGAFSLYFSYSFFPSNTIFACVVDPGVGSEREIIAIRTNDDKIYIAPNNGLLTHIIQNEIVQLAVAIKPEKFLENIKISNTFHGRDIMAPVAALLSKGAKFGELGTIIKPSDLVTLDNPFAEYQSNSFKAKIVHIDRFGDVITNIKVQDADLFEDRKIIIEEANVQLERLRTTFSDVSKGENLAYFGSSGLLEFATNQGNFAKENGNLEIEKEIVVTLT